MEFRNQEESDSRQIGFPSPSYTVLRIKWFQCEIENRLSRNLSFIKNNKKNVSRESILFIVIFFIYLSLFNIRVYF